MIFRKVPTGVRERERRGGEGHGRDHEAHKEARAQVARLRPPPEKLGDLQGSEFFSEKLTAEVTASECMQRKTLDLHA